MLTKKPLSPQRERKAAAPARKTKKLQVRKKPLPDSESVVERIITEIRDRVRSGQFAPGQRLVEADLQRLFSASRGPIREAIRRLTAEGILDQRHNIGAAVRELSPEEVINIFSVREVLEGLAARMAAQNIHLHNNRQMLLALEKEFSEERPATPLSYIKYNDRFHSLIVKLSDNNHLVRLEGQFLARIYRLQVDTLTSSPPFMSVREHKAIVKAILDRKPSRAEMLMRRHVRASLKKILEGAKPK
jgi:DNA-binding GntR family transcriptional regulator